MLHQEFKASYNNALHKITADIMHNNKDNPREIIEQLLINVTNYNQLLLEFIVSVLKEVDYKLLNEKGEFKKANILNWKNIPTYVAFAGFVKDKIIDIKNAIE